MRNPPSAENVASPAARPELGAVLFIAGAVVFVGTLLVDPARLWLLTIPACLLIAAYGTGAMVDRVVGRLLPESVGPPTVVLAVYIGVGLACISLLTFFSALACLLWIAGAAVLPCLAYGLLLVVRAGVNVQPVRERLATVVGGIVMGIAWLVAWLWATIPPIFYDELAYHLVIPQRALATGRLLTVPWVHYTLMPHASDLLLAWGMAFGGDLGARAALVALWVACSLAAWALADGIAPPGVSPWAATFAACALGASPTLWFLATLPFAETGLAAGVVIAAAILSVSQAERRPWMALGLLLGWIATIKLSGLYWVVAVSGAAITVGWSRWDLGRALAIMLVSIFPWWMRAVIHTGNPIYPMAYGFFGSGPWSDENQVRLMADLPYGSEGLGLVGLMRLPFDLVQHPERFGSASDVGAVAVVATCLLLVFPVIARLAGIEGRKRWLGDAAAVLVLVAGAGWVITSPTTRFFAPAFVIALAGFAGSLLYLRPRGRALAMVCMLALGVWGGYRFLALHVEIFSSSGVALGREEPNTYLARQLDHYRAARYVQEKLSFDTKLLFIGETRPYHFARETVAPYPFDNHPLRRWVLESSSAEGVAQRLVAEGFTHVVLNVREFKRLHDKYGVLAFSGEGAEIYDRRLRALPGTLKLLFASNGVYVFEIPRR